MHTRALPIAAIALSILVVTSGCGQSGPHVFRVASDRSLEQIRQDLPGVAKTLGYGVLVVHDMKAKLAERGHELSRPILVFEVCNPARAKTVLEANPAVSTALPCRIAAWREGDRVILAMIEPLSLLGLFGDASNLKNLPAEVDKELKTIIRKTAAGR